MTKVPRQTTKNKFNRSKSLLKLNFVLLFMLSLLSCESQQQADKSNQQLAETKQLSNENQIVEHETFTILALGDSLTEGLGVKKDGNYPALLQQILHQQGYPQISVINSGLSGETSSGLKNRLDWALQLKPDLTILNIGANDAMRGLPLKLTTDNINDIIKRIHASGSQVVLAGMQIYDNLGQEYVVGFKDMYPKLAKQNGLEMIPFFLEHVAGDPKLNQADMIHPTSAGYEIIVQRNVLPTVLPLIESMKRPLNKPLNRPLKIKQ